MPNLPETVVDDEDIFRTIYTMAWIDLMNICFSIVSQPSSNFNKLMIHVSHAAKHIFSMGTTQAKQTTGNNHSHGNIIMAHILFHLMPCMRAHVSHASMLAHNTPMCTYTCMYAHTHAHT